MARRASSLLTGDVLLRDVQEADLPVFFEHQLDPEATRMADFPARDRESFTTHWDRILEGLRGKRNIVGSEHSLLPF